jgi:hypothetical protein
MVELNHDCSRVVEIEEEPRHHLVIANEYVRAFAVEVGAHERTLCHHHPNDYLIYVASAAEIISAACDEEPKRLSYAAGECELSRAGLVHVVENLGDRPFRNVVVELLTPAGALRRGEAPVCVGGEAEVSPTFDNARAAIFSVAIPPGAEVQIVGPAIVGAPYSNDLSPAAVGEIEVKQNEICDLAWVPPAREARLWGCWNGSETTIVFQIGFTEEQGMAIPNLREPLKSLRAHAKEE